VTELQNRSLPVVKNLLISNSKFSLVRCMEYAYRFLSLTCLDCEKFVWLIAQRKVRCAVPKGEFCVVLFRLRRDSLFDVSVLQVCV